MIFFICKNIFPTIRSFAIVNKLFCNKPTNQNNKKNLLMIEIVRALEHDYR
jgi:hypothetical protein